ncbi:MAG: mandelate racemase [Rhodospirillales bacterium]|nr:mandelate racemase [Acetobacter sp.]
MTRRATDAPITKLAVACYTVPTDAPEGDGTLDWDSTTLVLVEATAGNRTGLGYSYTDPSAAELITRTLAKHVEGRSALDVPGAHHAMLHASRNLGRPGLVATAIAAVDNALWDLKCRLLDVSLLDLLGAAHDHAAVYGSGGFTTYSDEQLRVQLGGWAQAGFKAVKMKLGRASTRTAELARVRVARECIGADVELFVDANGAYDRKEALAMAERFAEFDVRWFEEPVSSDDLEGLRLLRDRGPAGMRIAAGEYGYDGFYFRRMLEAGAVDVLQADATRCLGLTGFLRAGALCETFSVPFSFHCAPALHASAACALPDFAVGEYFHDHARIENMLFDGTLQPEGGFLQPDRSRPGLGLEFKRSEAEKYLVR